MSITLPTVQTTFAGGPVAAASADPHLHKPAGPATVAVHSPSARSQTATARPIGAEGAAVSLGCRSRDPPVIADLAEFGRTGVICRRVVHLDVPVGVWRAAMRDAGRRDNSRVRTFLLPTAVADTQNSPDQVVFAVR